MGFRATNQFLLLSTSYVYIIHHLLLEKLLFCNNFPRQNCCFVNLNTHSLFQKVQSLTMSSNIGII